MNVKYFYRYFAPLDGVFSVCFYTDAYPEGIERDVGLPWNETGDGYLEGEDLHKYIMAHCPWYELRYKEFILGVDTSYIEKLFNEQDPNLV